MRTATDAVASPLKRCSAVGFVASGIVMDLRVEKKAIKDVQRISSNVPLTRW